MLSDVSGELTLVAIGIALLANVIFSTVVATSAEKRNQSWGMYFVIGLIFGFALPMLFVMLHDAIHRHWRAEDRHSLQQAEEEQQHPPTTTF